MLELIKPVTWFPPMWAYACGAIASGVAITEHLGLLIVGVILAGPVVCGMSQAANDWCDRHVDAINEPNPELVVKGIANLEKHIENIDDMLGKDRIFD